MQIEVKDNEIKVTTSDNVVFEMTWDHLRELEKAIQTIRKVQEVGGFNTLEITR